MTRLWVRTLAGAIAALATIAIAVQFLVIEPADRSARSTAREAAGREADLAARAVLSGAAAPRGTRILPVGAQPPAVGGIAPIGQDRIVWVQARPIVSFASDLRRRALLVAGIGVLAATGWTLWAGIVRRRSADRVAERQLETIAMVAHDLRSPLTGIGLAADRLVCSELPAARAAARAAIDRESRRLGVIADDILTICTETAAADARPTDALSNILEDVARRVGATHERAVLLQMDGAARVAPADARFARAIANVTENAARHSPPDRPVRLRAVEVDGVVEILVEDEGSGFDPSFTVTPFDRGADGGRAGLGLASSRRIVEALGGTLRLGRRSGGGGAVSLRLPTSGAAR